jgi:MinD-like ATPase involved in chromosome partitioning or flagellar assembly
MTLNLPRIRAHTPSSPRSSRCRCVIVAVTSAAASFAAAVPATAGEYTINACGADPGNYSTQAFEDFATRGMASPKGGVGKTTSAFVVGNLLASHLKLRAIAVDASPGFSGLGLFTAESARAESSFAELLDNADRLGTAAELRRYVARLPSGLHLLASSQDLTDRPNLGPDTYGELVALLSCYYDTVLLDLGCGVTNPLAQLAVDRADQLVLVTTPDQLTATLAIHALDQLGCDRTTVVVNRTHPRKAPELRAIEECLVRRNAPPPITIPDDRRLAMMLASGTYSLEALDRPIRLSVKRFGLRVAERLV